MNKTNKTSYLWRSKVETTGKVFIFAYLYLPTAFEMHVCLYSLLTWKDFISFHFKRKLLLNFAKICDNICVLLIWPISLWELYIPLQIRANTAAYTRTPYTFYYTKEYLRVGVPTYSHNRGVVYSIAERSFYFYIYSIYFSNITRSTTMGVFTFSIL